MKRATLERAFENLVERPSDVAIRQKTKRAVQLIQAYLKKPVNKYWGDIKDRSLDFRYDPADKSSPSALFMQLDRRFPKLGLYGIVFHVAKQGTNKAGGFGKLGSKPVIVLYIKEQKDGDFIDLIKAEKTTLLNVFQASERVFVHEYAHFLDDAHKGRQPSAKLQRTGDPKTDIKAYLNAPSEMQSYLSEFMWNHFAAMDSIARQWSKDPAKKDMATKGMDSLVGNSFQDYWKQLLKNSQKTIFPKFIKALTPKNRKRVIGRAYTVWQELKKRRDEIVQKWAKPEAKENMKMKEGMQALAAKLFKENYACPSEDQDSIEASEDELTVEEYNKRSEALAEAVGELHNALSSLQGAGSGLTEAFSLIEGTPGYSEDHKSLMSVLKDINEAGCKVFGLTQRSCHDLSVLEAITKKLREDKRPY